MRGLNFTAGLSPASLFARRLAALSQLQPVNSSVCTLSNRCRTYASSSSERWKERQRKDEHSVKAKVQGLKSRAAFKLLEINDRYKLFSAGQTVVDLGFAPGSWTQVAVDRTNPDGRVIGIDILPAKPPQGASSVQGNFLSPNVRARLKTLLASPDKGRARAHQDVWSQDLITEGIHAGDLQPANTSEAVDGSEEQPFIGCVDVLLSDMCEPWPLADGLSRKRSLSEPYRMMNTSGVNFRDHSCSMDLCNSALDFALETLKEDGHFVCKFYQGAEDKALETRLRNVFLRVHREKPKSSRSVCPVSFMVDEADKSKESKEAYFVALSRQPT